MPQSIETTAPSLQGKVGHSKAKVQGNNILLVHAVRRM